MASVDRHAEIAEQRALFAQRLIASGEKEKLKEFLRARLAAEWREELRRFCREKLEKRGSDEPVTAEWIMREVAPQARQMVPQDVRAELLAQIKKFLAQQIQHKQ